MFLLFAGQFYCGGVGMEDYNGSFNTLKEAQDRAAYLLNVGGFLGKDWYQIVDKDTMTVVDKGHP